MCVCVICDGHCVALLELRILGEGSRLSQCQEFSDVHLRVTVLNTLNKDKNRITIRYEHTYTYSFTPSLPPSLTHTHTQTQSLTPSLTHTHTHKHTHTQVTERRHESQLVSFGYENFPQLSPHYMAQSAAGCSGLQYRSSHSTRTLRKFAQPQTLEMGVCVCF